MNTHPKIPDAKPGHTGLGAGPHIGPTMYLIIRHDDVMMGCEPTRHDAIAEKMRFHQCNRYHIEPVPIGAIPLLDYKGT